MKNSRIFLLAGALMTAPVANAASAADIQLAAQADPSGAAMITSEAVAKEPRKAAAFVKAAIVGAGLQDKPQSVVVVVQAAIAAAGGQAAEIVAAALQVAPGASKELNVFLAQGGGSQVPAAGGGAPSGGGFSGPRQTGPYMKPKGSGVNAVGGGNAFLIPPATAGTSIIFEQDAEDDDDDNGGGSSSGGGGRPPVGTNGGSR